MNAILQLMKLRSYALRHGTNFLCASRCVVSRDFHEIKIFESDSRLNRVPPDCAAASFPAIQVCKRNYGMKAPTKNGKQKKGSKPKVVLTDEEINVVLDIQSFREKLALRVDKLKEDYLKHVTVRTSAGSIETLQVKYEGQDYPLNEIAQISRKNQNLFVVNLTAVPQAVKAVLEAIQKSGMGLNPQQEGNTLYLPIPPVTREFRENLVKSARALFMKTKDDLHEAQNHAIKGIKNKKGNFSDDLIFSVQQQIVFETETSVAQAESIFVKKQTDILAGK